MCGIVGIYNFNRNPLREDYIGWCLKTMKHRGPDSLGVWHNSENYIAGFARLAIRDLSAKGYQPMLSSCGNFCITFNGEIYNTAELKNLIKNHHSQFVSTSDTEVLLYTLMHLGVKKTLQAADGIFAFSFYDIRANVLVLARDRVGVKPLYVGMNSECLIYSSQYDHIINHPIFANETINAQAIGSFLSLGYIPENNGAINKTKLLLHGNYYVIKNGQMEQFQYYDYPIASNHQTKKDLDDVLNKSVNDQLISDVPIGTFMSGGVDSTLITFFANRSKQVNSFTLGVRNSQMDESINAKAFAEIFDTNHHCKYFSENDLLKLLDENAKAFSEPFADYSSLPVLLLSKYAKEKVTVILSGDGGDELFWGYPRNITALKYFNYYKNSKNIRRIKIVFNKIFENSKIDIGRHWNEDDFISYAYHTLFISGALGQLQNIFKKEAAEDYHFQLLKNTKTKFCDQEINGMNALRKLEVDVHLQRILMKVDRASMYHSLEVRVPMLSNQMLDLSAAYTFKECIEGANGKMNLKKSLIKKATEQLVMQPKKGFSIPMGDWIRNEIRNEVEEKILNMPSHFSDLFNQKKLELLLHEHMTHKQDWGWMIWALYSLVKWDTTHRKTFINY